MVDELFRQGQKRKRRTETEEGRTPRSAFWNNDLKIRMILEHACVMLTKLPKVDR